MKGICTKVIFGITTFFFSFSSLLQANEMDFSLKAGQEEKLRAPGNRFINEFSQLWYEQLALLQLALDIVQARKLGDKTRNVKLVKELLTVNATEIVDLFENKFSPSETPRLVIINSIVAFTDKIISLFRSVCNDNQEEVNKRSAQAKDLISKVAANFGVVDEFYLKNGFLLYSDNLGGIAVGYHGYKTLPEPQAQFALQAWILGMRSAINDSIPNIATGVYNANSTPKISN